MKDTPKPTLKAKGFDISSFTLHIIAMVTMFCDHLWGTVLMRWDWLTNIGRIAFPIFAFLIVEGYFHTHDFKKYCRRMLIFAVISEIPFNIMYASNLLYPFHQNVLWTFLIALIGMKLMDVCREKFNPILAAVLCMGIVFVSYFVGLLTFVDYYGPGVITVYIFYFFRGDNWWQRLGQLVGLCWVNFGLLGGLTLELVMFGHKFYFVQQGIAVLAIIPIWLYRGRQGMYNRTIKNIYYWFYPVHALILGLIYTYL